MNCSHNYVLTLPSQLHNQRSLMREGGTALINESDDQSECHMYPLLSVDNHQVICQISSLLPTYLIHDLVQSAFYF